MPPYFANIHCHLPSPCRCSLPCRRRPGCAALRVSRRTARRDAANTAQPRRIVALLDEKTEAKKGETGKTRRTEYLVGGQVVRRACLADTRDRNEAHGAEHPGQHHGGEHRPVARRDHHRRAAAHHRRADQPRRGRGHLGGRAWPAPGRHHAERRSIHHGGSDRLAATRLHHVAGHVVPRRGRASSRPPRVRPKAASAVRSTCTPIGPGTCRSGFTYSYSANGERGNTTGKWGRAGQRSHLLTTMAAGACWSPLISPTPARHNCEREGSRPVRRRAQWRECGQRGRLQRIPGAVERGADSVPDHAECRRQRRRQWRREVQRRVHGQPGHRPVRHHHRSAGASPAMLRSRRTSAVASR